MQKKLRNACAKNSQHRATAPYTGRPCLKYPDVPAICNPVQRWFIIDLIARHAKPRIKDIDIEYRPDSEGQ